MFIVDPKKLKALRDAKGKSQGEVAAALALSQGAYSTREKTGNFDDEQVKTICKFLGIKKEQIELVEVDKLDFIASKAIQTESALKVILSALAEIMANQTGNGATKIRTDLEAAVDSLSKQALERLRHSE